MEAGLGRGEEYWLIELDPDARAIDENSCWWAIGGESALFCGDIARWGDWELARFCDRGGDIPRRNDSYPNGWRRDWGYWTPFLGVVSSGVRRRPRAHRRIQPAEGSRGEERRIHRRRRWKIAAAARGHTKTLKLQSTQGRYKSGRLGDIASTQRRARTQQSASTPLKIRDARLF
uniref:Uncharacterized protein n=1 Tax=Coccidioides posadasii RMSCC 3488 TaxID=454284 RepID=A0A0J6F7M3_COCPO|nr:hypothetical protein CPAG_01292 [Coccidioides posadasii RMSCC 3488]